MLFQLSRIVLVFLLTATGIRLVRKSAIRRKKPAIVLTFAGAIILALLTSVFPPENIVLRFDTPESVFKYAFVEKLQNTLQGNDSCLVIYSDRRENSTGVRVVSKDARGYFVPTPFTAKATMRQLEEEGFVQVLHVNGSADCYLTTLIPYGFVDNDLANASESAGEMDGIKYLLVPYSSALQVYVYTDRSDNEAIQKVIAPLFEEYFR